MPDTLAILRELLDQLAAAVDVTDVNIAAGIALEELTRS
jgi:hypothetical protein